MENTLATQTLAVTSVACSCTQERCWIVGSRVQAHSLPPGLRSREEGSWESPTSAARSQVLDSCTGCWQGGDSENCTQTKLITLMIYDFFFFFLGCTSDQSSTAPCTRTETRCLLQQLTARMHRKQKRFSRCHKLATKTGEYKSLDLLSQSAWKTRALPRDWNSQSWEHQLPWT